VLRNISITDITASVDHDGEYERVVQRKEPCALISGTMYDMITGLTLDNVRLQSEGGVTDPALGSLDIPEFLDYTGTYAESFHMKRPCAPASGIFLRHIENANLRHIHLSTRRPDARPPLALIDVRGGFLFDVAAAVTDLTPCVALKSDCADLLESGYRALPPGQAKILSAEVSGDHAAAMRAWKTEARKIDAMFDAESQIIDAARKVPLIKKLYDWTIVRSEGRIEYAADIKIDELNEVYLFFTRVAGDIRVTINGAEAASRYLPDKYRWPFLYAADITEYVRGGPAEIKITIIVTGSGADMLLPVQLRGK